MWGHTESIIATHCHTVRDIEGTPARVWASVINDGFMYGPKGHPCPAARVGVFALALLCERIGRVILTQNGPNDCPSSGALGKRPCPENEIRIELIARGGSPPWRRRTL